LKKKGKKEANLARIAKATEDHLNGTVEKPLWHG
jgi:hypothetical protein